MALRIWVNVKPRARLESVAKTAAGEYTVSVRAPAREGEANSAVIELLAEHFSAPKSAIRILRGERARRKLVEILAPRSRQN